MKISDKREEERINKHYRTNDDQIPQTADCLIEIRGTWGVGCMDFKLGGANGGAEVRSFGRSSPPSRSGAPPAGGVFLVWKDDET